MRPNVPPKLCQQPYDSLPGPSASLHQQLSHALDQHAWFVASSPAMSNFMSTPRPLHHQVYAMGWCATPAASDRLSSSPFHSESTASNHVLFAPRPCRHVLSVAPLRPQSSHCRTVLYVTMSCFDKVRFAPYVPRRVATSATLSCQKPRPCQHSFSSNQPYACFSVPHFVIMSCLFAVVVVVFLKASVRMGSLQHMYAYVPAFLHCEKHPLGPRGPPRHVASRDLMSWSPMTRPPPEVGGCGPRTVVACTVVPRMVPLRIVIPGTVLPIAWCRTVSYCIVGCRVSAYRVVPCPVPTYCIVLCRIVPCHTVQLRSVSYGFVSYRTVSHRMVSYRNPSHRVLSYCITSCRTLSSSRTVS